MLNMEQESRAQIGKELSKIYFDRSHSDFNQQEYFYALSEEIRIVDTIGEIRFKADGTVHEREQKWRHGIKDIEIIIQKPIAHSKHIEWRNKILIPTAHILETNLNGKIFILLRLVLYQYLSMNYQVNYSFLILIIYRLSKLMIKDIITTSEIHKINIFFEPSM